MDKETTLTCVVKKATEYRKLDWALDDPFRRSKIIVLVPRKLVIVRFQKD